MNMRLTIYKSCILFLGLSVGSCNLLDVTEVEPVNQLSEEQAITTVNQAQSALLGTYGVLKTGLELIVYCPANTALLGGTMDVGASGGTVEASYRDNNVDPQDYELDAVYTKWYAVINNTNHIIQKAPMIQTTDPKRDQVVGEARFLRGLAHFYLLRLFGQFYDYNSKWGIVIKDKPIQSAVSQPRSTVKQTYEFILADLDYAIANAANFTKTVYGSRQAAMALKAKVLLYAKQYSEAAALAKQLIQTGPFQLEVKR